MIAPDHRAALNDALSQLNRLARAPAPARVRVDGRSLADLLGFAAEYGALIRFFDLADLPDGDWSAFFRIDPSIALALCAGLDLAEVETRFERLLQALRHAKSIEERLEHWSLLEKIVLRLLRIAEQELSQASLQHALADLMVPGRLVLLIEPARRLSDHLGAGPAGPRLRERAANGWFQALTGLLDDFIAALMTHLGRARGAALAALEASLHGQRHPPQSALWDAFALLFRHAQHAINRFPRNLLDFYQSTVLRQDQRDGRADQLTLTFALAPGHAPTILDKGTAFRAGSAADGESIVYALDAALTVDAAAVARLRTVTLAAQAPAAGAMPLPAQVLSGVVRLSDSAPAIATPFPLFGSGTVGTDGVLTTSKASLGFAVASPCLMLTGGTRTVRLELLIDPDSYATLAAVYSALGLDEHAAAPSREAQLPWLAQLLAGAFALRYSSAGGWIDIPGYAVAAPATADAPYVLSFQLGADAVPWVAPADGPATPTLYASLVQEPVTLDTLASPVYPYTVLSCVLLAGLSIRVGVTDLADLQVAGPAGPVDPAQPFPLFGSPPVQGATLTVGAPELFAKQVDSFTLSIDWFGLPVTSTGFYGYYQAYVIDADGQTVPSGSLFNNQTFTAGMGVLNPGAWTIDAWTPCLFQSAAGATTPEPQAKPLPRTVLAAPVSAHQPDAYYDPASSAVSLSLAQPDYAFGAILYAPNVMAASLQLTAAAAACAQECGRADWADAAAAQLDALASAGAAASDRQFEGRVQAALQQAVAALDGAALSALDDAIAASGATAGQQAGWSASLAEALGQPKSGTPLQRLRQWRAPPDYATVHANLAQWLAGHSAELAGGTAAACALTGQAQALLAAGGGAQDACAKAAGKPATVARPLLSAGVRSTQATLKNTAAASSQDCLQKCLAASSTPAFPNQPWLPMAAGVRVNYTAHAALPPSAGATGAAGAVTFFHLAPFDEIEAVDWPAGASVALLAPVAQAGALYIDLSAPATAPSLLFRLAPPAAGWPTATPALSWARAGAGDSWCALTPQSDSTNGMRNSGIVRFALDAAPNAAPLRLRVGFADGDAALFPALAGLASNAANATWVGPGGAARLAKPLPAGTISTAVAALPAIAAIEQPDASAGGQDQASGAPFDLWLAERLRHKNYAIQAWDYASLVLAAFPSLWQLAVVAASDGSPAQAPGNVWIVPVPGPDTPAIADPTTPSNDAQMLKQIAAFLATKISPFIQLNVTNPPYLRLTVHAELLFGSDDAVPACIARLNQELIGFLSPWPAPALGPRPDNYYTRNEVAHFVRNRPYVRGILSLHLVPDAAGCAADRPYYTSALAHALTGKPSSAAAELLRRPNYALPGPAAHGAAT